MICWRNSLVLHRWSTASEALYEEVCRHFLATVSPDATVREAVAPAVAVHWKIRTKNGSFLDKPSSWLLCIYIYILYNIYYLLLYIYYLIYKILYIYLSLLLLLLYYIILYYIILLLYYYIILYYIISYHIILYIYYYYYYYYWYIIIIIITINIITIIIIVIIIIYYYYYYVLYLTINIVINIYHYDHVIFPFDPRTILLVGSPWGFRRQSCSCSWEMLVSRPAVVASLPSAGHE